jgi:ATP-dependent Zn protease
MKTNLQIVYITFVITMLSVFNMQAQTDIIDWESSFQTIEDVDEEEVENWEMQYEELSDLIEHKIDINSATREDLLRLPFLSNQQVMDIMEYMYHYGSMKSLAE